MYLDEVVIEQQSRWRQEQYRRQVIKEAEEKARRKEADDAAAQKHYANERARDVIAQPVAPKDPLDWASARYIKMKLTIRDPNTGNVMLIQDKEYSVIRQHRVGMEIYLVVASEMPGVEIAVDKHKATVVPDAHA